MMTYIKLARQQRGREKESCKVSWIQFVWFQRHYKKIGGKAKNRTSDEQGHKITMTEKNTREAATAGVL